MTRARGRRSSHLRLVKPSDIPPILTDRAAQLEFERLTQALVDIAIEITDIVSGDPDLEIDEATESNGDEENEVGF